MSVGLSVLYLKQDYGCPDVQEALPSMANREGIVKGERFIQAEEKPEYLVHRAYPLLDIGPKFSG